MIEEKPNIQKQTLVDTTNHRITYFQHPEKSAKLVITFDAHGHVLRDKGFGSDMLIESGYDHIFVSHSLNSQYQSLDIEEFCNAVSPITSSYEVYTYGSSLGGYCAVYYAGCIGARAIAISPRNSAHPSISNPIFSELSFTHCDIDQTPLSFISPIIIFDPFQEVDLAFIYNYILPAYPNAELHEVPYAGHLIAEALLEIGEIKNIALSIIEYGLVPKISLTESNSSYFCAELASKKLQDGEKSQAAKLLNSSLKIRHDNDNLDQLLSLVREGSAPQSLLINVINPYLKKLQESSLFDDNWYVTMYETDLKASGFQSNPEVHYLVFGASEGKNPSLDFNSVFYLDTYSDVKDSGMNPLLHYLYFGFFEQRIISPITS